MSASYAAPELGVVVDEGMKVVDVDPGNAAEKAGVQKGDRLIVIELTDLAIMPAPPIWDPNAPPTPGYPPLDYL